MASRTALLPRKEKETLRDPAAHLRQREGLLDPPRGLDEGDRVVVVLLHARGHGEDVRVEDDVLGREAHLLGQDPVGAGADLDSPLDGRRLAPARRRPSPRPRRRSAGRAGPGRLKTSSPSLREIEFTTPLPWRHLSPASITLQFERVDHDRDAGDVGLGGEQVQERRHGLVRVEQPLVHVHVEDLGAALDLLAGDLRGPRRTGPPGRASRTSASR